MAFNYPNPVPTQAEVDALKPIQGETVGIIPKYNSMWNIVVDLIANYLAGMGHMDNVQAIADAGTAGAYTDAEIAKIAPITNILPDAITHFIGNASSNGPDNNNTRVIAPIIIILFIEMTVARIFSFR